MSHSDLWLPAFSVLLLKSILCKARSKAVGHLNCAHEHCMFDQGSSILENTPTLPNNSLAVPTVLRSVKTKEGAPQSTSGVCGQRFHQPFSFVSKQTLSTGAEVTIDLNYSSASGARPQHSQETNSSMPGGRQASVSFLSKSIEDGPQKPCFTARGL